MGSLVGLTLWHHEYKLGATSDSLPDKMVAYFCMIHVAVWVMVGLFDRCATVVLAWLICDCSFQAPLCMVVSS